jgi:hypothetical protein
MMIFVAGIWTIAGILSVLATLILPSVLTVKGQHQNLDCPLLLEWRAEDYPQVFMSTHLKIDESFAQKRSKG